MKKSSAIGLGAAITAVTVLTLLNTPLLHEKLFAKEESKTAVKYDYKESSRPNVIFIMSDEHSPHAVHSTGNPIIQTPNLDSLGQNGITFTSSYCQDPICVPSRASLLTGKMPFHVNTFDNNGGFPDKEKTMAEVFTEAGYKAEWLGKQHWGGNSGFGDLNLVVQKTIKKEGYQPKINRDPGNATIAKWPSEKNDESISTDYALKFLEDNKDSSFFLGVSYLRPHFPYIIQQQYYDLYKNNIDVPVVTKDMLKQLPTVSKIEAERYKLNTLTPAEIAKARAVYYGMVTYVDDQIGRILKKVDELGLGENTIIVYTADHGELAGEHGIWYKNSFYEAAASVPTMMSFPSKLPKAVKIDAPVMNMDLFPTLCELCDLKIPEGVEGKSLIGLVNNTEDASGRYAISENYRDGIIGKMIRQGNYKYIWYDTGEEQLFDLQKDSMEVVNLANDAGYADIKSKLKATLFEKAGVVKIPKSKKSTAVKGDDDE